MGKENQPKVYEVQNVLCMRIEEIDGLIAVDVKFSIPYADRNVFRPSWYYRLVFYPENQGPEPQGWQPIETAPKDGTTIFVWTGNSKYPSRHEASWRPPSDWEWEKFGSAYPEPPDTIGPEPGWFADEYEIQKLHGESFPTHWMPIPAGPIT